MNFKTWKEQKLKLLNLCKDKVGNELPDNKVVAGGDLKTGPKQFSGQLKEFKKRIKNESQPEGLGDKGMDSVGNSTFKKPVGAGETPTISNGMPVGEPKGQFESFTTTMPFVGQDSHRPGNPGMNPKMVPPGTNENTPEFAKPEDQRNPYNLPQLVKDPLDKSFDLADNLGPQSYKKFTQAAQEKIDQGTNDPENVPPGDANLMKRLRLRALQKDLQV